jgi:membrane-associated phospholipid phosphatase
MRRAAPLAALLLAFPAAPACGAAGAAQAAGDSAAAPRHSVGARATHTAKAFASDAGYVLSSPFRLTGRGFLWTAGVVAATAVIYGYDGEILEAFHRSRGNQAYDAVLELGERAERLGFMGKTAPYWVGGALLGTAFGVPRLQSLCLDVIESHLITGGMRNSAKTLVGRRRPSDGADRATFFENGTSLPSGHASVVFEVATILTRHTEGAPLAVRVPVAVVAYGVATGVAVQRVDSRGHWPSDVFLGAASGALIANTVARRNRERREREHGEDRGVALTPWLDEAGAPRGVLLTTWF